MGVFSPKFDKVNFHPKAVKELKKLDRQIIRIIQRDVQEKLAVDPKNHGEPLRAPLTGCYKLKYKSLNLRLVYTIRDEQLTIIKISDDQEIQQEIEGIVSILAIGERTRERVYRDALNRKEK